MKCGNGCYEKSCPRCSRCRLHQSWSGDCASCEPSPGAARLVTEFDMNQRRERAAFVRKIEKGTTA